MCILYIYIAHIMENLLRTNPPTNYLTSKRREQNSVSESTTKTCPKSQVAMLAIHAKFLFNF